MPRQRERPPGNTLRLFIAIFPPPEIRVAMHDLVSDRERFGGFRPVPPQNIHLTLKFLGEARHNDADRVARSLAEVSRLHTGFQLRPMDLGGFPNSERARVLWMGVDGEFTALSELRESVEGAAVKAGFPPEWRSFTPHMTLGRYGEPGRIPDVETASMDEFGVEEVCLVGSSSSGRGVVYNVLGRYGLRPGGGAVG